MGLIPHVENIRQGQAVLEAAEVAEVVQRAKLPLLRAALGGNSAVASARRAIPHHSCQPQVGTVAFPSNKSKLLYFAFLSHHSTVLKKKFKLVCAVNYSEVLHSLVIYIIYSL